jgi:hypothetical protein
MFPKLVSAAAPTRAAVVPPFETVAKRAALVIEGEVLAVGDVSGGSLRACRYAVRVTTVFRGRCGVALTLVLPDGELQPLDIGDRILVALGPNGGGDHHLASLGGGLVRIPRRAVAG